MMKSDAICELIIIGMKRNSLKLGEKFRAENERRTLPYMKTIDK